MGTMDLGTLWGLPTEEALLACCQEEPLQAARHGKTLWNSLQLTFAAFQGSSFRHLRALAQREPLIPPPTGPRCTDRPFIEEAVRWIGFSSGAYGWQLLNHRYYEQKRRVRVLDRLPSSDALNRRLFCEHVGNVSDEDILHCRWKAFLYRPSWLLVRDRTRKAIVLVVRGTLTKTDLIADLDVDFVPFSVGGVEGLVHQGILQAANNIRKEALERVVAALLWHPDHELVLVGHSLGAGVVILLQLYISDYHPDIRSRCFAFAPPAMFSRNLSLHTQRYPIISFVLGCDVVPRLSLRTLRDIVRDPSVPDMGARNPLLELHMLPPGTMFLLRSPTGRVSDYDLEYASPQDFDTILLAKDMFEDHLIENYDKAFSAVLTNLLPSAPLWHFTFPASSVPFASFPSFS